MNGANKLVNAMKKVSQSSTQPTSDMVTVTVIDTNPLKFQLENNRLPISSDFYELSNLYKWDTVTEGQVFRAQTFNAGQKYYILEPYPLPANTNSGIMDERISTNRTDLDTLIPRFNILSSTVTTINTTVQSIGIGEDTLPILNGVNLNSVDLNGFSYILNATYGSTSIPNGYFLQLTYTTNYKVQFHIAAGSSGVLQYRKLVNGSWSAWANV